MADRVNFVKGLLFFIIWEMLPNKKETIKKMAKIALKARNLSKLNNNYPCKGEIKG